jgi:hypothetical protein
MKGEKSMEKFAGVNIALGKDIKSGDKESLQTLFESAERYKRMELLVGADEDTNIKVVLEGLGEADLKLGDDMEKGDQKTIMTLFWFLERDKPITIKRDAKKGEMIALEFFKS